MISADKLGAPNGHRIATLHTGNTLANINYLKLLAFVATVAILVKEFLLMVVKWPYHASVPAARFPRYPLVAAPSTLG
jgi:hypothetical protein